MGDRNGLTIEAGDAVFFFDAPGADGVFDAGGVGFGVAGWGVGRSQWVVAVMSWG